jgi:hypothetical protein
MRQLEEENAKLKRLVADLSLTKACALFHMSRSLYGYRSVARDSSALLLVLGRCSEQNRRLAPVLQREPSPLRTAVGDTRRIRPSGKEKRLDGGCNDAGNLHFWTVLIPV